MQLQCSHEVRHLDGKPRPPLQVYVTKMGSIERSSAPAYQVASYRRVFRLGVVVSVTGWHVSGRSSAYIWSSGAFPPPNTNHRDMDPFAPADKTTSPPNFCCNTYVLPGFHRISWRQFRRVPGYKMNYGVRSLNNSVLHPHLPWRNGKLHWLERIPNTEPIRVPREGHSRVPALYPYVSP